MQYVSASKPHSSRPQAENRRPSSNACAQRASQTENRLPSHNVQARRPLQPKDCLPQARTRSPRSARLQIPDPKIRPEVRSLLAPKSRTQKSAPKSAASLPQNPGPKDPAPRPPTQSPFFCACAHDFLARSRIWIWANNIFNVSELLVFSNSRDRVDFCCRWSAIVGIRVGPTGYFEMGEKTCAET